MPLELHWPQIAIRLTLAAVLSFLIGLNRDEQGHPAGIRTTMLVCLAATLAMLQVNTLLPLQGKAPTGFNTLDLMRLPLGILSGIGFIGAGVILKNQGRVTGVTTAATLWYVTMLGLLCGGGQLPLATTAGILGILILWGLKRVEAVIPRSHHASLHIELADDGPEESDLRQTIESAACTLVSWQPTFQPGHRLRVLDCDIRWTERANRRPATPAAIEGLRRQPGIATLTWRE